MLGVGPIAFIFHQRVEPVEFFGRNRPGNQDPLCIPACNDRSISSWPGSSIPSSTVSIPRSAAISMSPLSSVAVLEAADDAAAIELDDVDRECSQMLQRPVAGTEIVEGDSHTMGSQFA